MLSSVCPQFLLTFPRFLCYGGEATHTRRCIITIVVYSKDVGQLPCHPLLSSQSDPFQPTTYRIATFVKKGGVYDTQTFAA